MGDTTGEIKETRVDQFRYFKYHAIAWKARALVIRELMSN